MGRKRLGSQLDVWMNGVLVGYWRIGSAGVHEFTYDDRWLDHAFVRPISLSLPLLPATQSHRGTIVEYFFENLLPDNREIRRRLQRRFATRGIGAFDLLAEVGRDCVGAMQLLPEGMVPEALSSVHADGISDGEIARLLRATAGEDTRGAFSDDVLRISLAGAQEKTALLRRDGRWYVPRASTPSTHILKLPLGEIGRMRADMTTSVENEWLCSRILRAFGQEVAETEIHRFEERKVLVVERFDRRWTTDGKWIVRLLQEDMCQVHGVSPEQKYESDGGPGIAQIMNFLLGSAQAQQDRRSFFRAQILFWLLCAVDGHAKNFSVFILPQGRYSLAPLYDVVSAYPIMGRGKNKLPRQEARMAMAITGTNRHYRWDQIRRRHWESTAARCGFSAGIDTVLDEITTLTPAVIRTVEAELPRRFPSAVSEPIFEGLRNAVKRLS